MFDSDWQAGIFLGIDLLFEMYKQIQLIKCVYEEYFVLSLVWGGLRLSSVETMHSQMCKR